MASGVHGNITCANILNIYIYIHNKQVDSDTSWWYNSDIVGRQWEQKPSGLLKQGLLDNSWSTSMIFPVSISQRSLGFPQGPTGMFFASMGIYWQTEGLPSRKLIWTLANRARGRSDSTKNWWKSQGLRWFSRGFSWYCNWHQLAMFHIMRLDMMGSK